MDKFYRVHQDGEAPGEFFHELDEHARTKGAAWAAQQLGWAALYFAAALEDGKKQWNQGAYESALKRLQWAALEFASHKDLSLLSREGR